MRWEKLGRLFVPDGKISWMKSHAMLPVAVPIGEDVFRVYFSSRDQRGRSHVGQLVLELSPRPAVLDVQAEPVFSPGSLGAFDDNGVVGSSLVTMGEEEWLYYVGISPGGTVPFRSFTGLAVRGRGEKVFRRYSLGPVVGLTMNSPFLAASPFVLKEGGVFKMWLLYGVKWELVGGKPRHYYHVRYMESPDGVNWQLPGQVAIDFKSPDEYAIARPSVLKEQWGYRMWYCYRGQAYRIGYAESRDGLTWERMDEEAGIDVSEEGWDSQMVAYPFVIRLRDETYMLYNGNNYGETGFGIARLCE
jgi:hypothetical protein